MPFITPLRDHSYQILYSFQSSFCHSVWLIRKNSIRKLQNSIKLNITGTISCATWIYRTFASKNYGKNEFKMLESLIRYKSKTWLANKSFNSVLLFSLELLQHKLHLDIHLTLWVYQTVWSVVALPITQ